MLVNCEKLTKAGIDTDALMKRLMGNESLVKVFVKKFLEDKNYEELISALDRDDMKEAEIKSHTLKGMCGNMSILPLYTLFTEQTNAIRQGEYQKAKGMMKEIEICFENTVENLKEWLSE